MMINIKHTVDAGKLFPGATKHIGPEPHDLLEPRRTEKSTDTYACKNTFGSKSTETFSLYNRNDNITLVTQCFTHRTALCTFYSHKSVKRADSLSPTATKHFHSAAIP